jgi:phenylacetate-CoA ligase
MDKSRYEKHVINRTSKGEQRFFRASEVMPSEERNKYLEDQLRRVVEHAYRKAPAIRAKLEKAGVSPSDIRTVRDLEKIPVTKKDDLVDQQKTNPVFGGFLTVPIERLGRIYVSPGPVFDPGFAFTSARARRTLAGALRAMGFGSGDVVLNTWPYQLTPTAFGIDEALRQLGAVVIPSGSGNTELQVQIIHRLNVTGFCGTAGFLMTIINKAGELGYDFRRDFRLQKAFAGAELGGKSIRACIEQYGIRTFDMYGTSDVGLLAYECAEHSMHIAEETIVEIVDTSTARQLGPGEIGEVVATPFEKAYPLLRFGTGDLAYFSTDSCRCGRTSHTLSPILGRVGQAARIRGGLVYPRQLDEAILRFRNISKYQLVISRPAHRDVLLLRVELAVDEEADRDELSRAVIDSVAEITRVRVDQVEFVGGGMIGDKAKAIVDERVY